MGQIGTRIASLSALLVAAQAMASMPGGADEVTAIEAHGESHGGTVVLRGTHPPMFSVFRLTSPDRIVVDLAGADISKAKAPERSGVAGLGAISAVQFQKGETRVGRVVMEAAPSLAYDVKVVGNDVIVALSSTESAKTDAEGSVPAGAPAPEPQDDHLIDKSVDSTHGKKLGHHVLSASVQKGDALSLSILTDGPVGDVTVLRLRDPNRIAVDLAAFDGKGAKAHPGSAAPAIRFGKVMGGARVVFDLTTKDVPKLALHRTGFGLSLVALDSAPAAVAVAQSAPVLPIAPVAVPAVQAKLVEPAAVARVVAPSVAEAAPAVHPVSAPSADPVAVAARLAPTPTVQPTPIQPVMAPVAVAAVPTPVRHQPTYKATSEMADLRVTGDARQQQIVMELPVGADVGRPTSVDANGFELQLHGVTVPDRLRRTLDASAFGGPVATVSSFNVSHAEGRVVVSVSPGTRQDVTREGGTLTWRFTSPQRAEKPADEGAAARTAAVHTDQAETQVAGFTTAAAETGSDLPRRTRYTGRRISLEFKDIDIQNLLRLFADISHKNVVVSDDVKGKVTIALRNVPWDQAFDLILKTHGLGKEETGNIIRVAPDSALQKERKNALEAQKARAQLEPLRVRLIPVNYALAGDVSDKLKDVLSDRGVVTVDGRTNVLIVKDIAENLAKAEGMVRNLDTQTPQVLIESRIVEAATAFAREIGIQWGGNASFSPSTGNATGLQFPSTATAAGAAGGSPNAGTAATPNFAVNLPAAIGPGSGGGLGFIFGSAGGAFNLNLRISALENNGVVKTVSAPKVATLDNQEATISQGVSIPFAQVSAAGVQTAFIEARLELKVTPHVTSDGSVLLKISATNNQPNAGITGANGQPSISRKEAKTNMLVKDGDTTVIGGIYTRATGVSVNEVPLFGKIPILGWLFKHRADSDNRSELLIFITPRILNRQQVVAAGN